MRRLAMNRVKLLDVPQPPRRYQWENPGDLLHGNIKKLGCSNQAGHRAHGDRRRNSRGAGWAFVHVAIDGASRIAFAQISPTSARRASLLSSALRFYETLGVTVR